MAADTLCVAFSQSSRTKLRIKKYSSDNVFHTNVNSLARSPQRRRYSTSPYLATCKLGLVYSSSTGNTRKVAHLIKQCLGQAVCEPVHVASVRPSDLQQYEEGIIIGAPTWATKCDQMRTGTPMDDLMWLLRSGHSGVEVLPPEVPWAVFGCGDAGLWPEDFVDALGEMHQTMQGVGGRHVGTWRPPPGQEYLNTHSKSFRVDSGEGGGYFVGLPIDHMNQPELTCPRVQGWCRQLAREMNLEHRVGEINLPSLEAVPTPTILSDAVQYPDVTAEWERDDHKYSIFGTQLTSGWYKFDEGFGAAGRWIKFTDNVMMVRAGNRGQPDWWLDYKSIIGFTTTPGSVSSEVSIVLELSCNSDPDTRYSWGNSFLLQGIYPGEVQGMYFFLKERGALLG